MIIPLSAQAEPPSYPLICRGGSGMRIATAHDVPDGIRTGNNSMTVYFRAGRIAANPRPGSVSGGIALSVPANLKIFGLRDQLNFRSRYMGMDELPVMVPVGG